MTTANRFGLTEEMFAHLSSDSWIREQSSIDPAKLHALGMIALGWNLCEFRLFFLFAILLGVPTKTAWVIAHDLGDLAISDRIRELAKIKSLPKKDCETIDGFLKVYDICRQNRNSFVHFQVQRAEQGGFNLARLKGPSGKLDQLPNALKDFRRVSEEIFDLVRGLKILIDAVRPHAGQLLPLPNIPPMPELLWKPPQQAPTKPKRQPRPSSASRREKALAGRT